MSSHSVCLGRAPIEPCLKLVPSLRAVLNHSWFSEVYIQAMMGIGPLIVEPELSFGFGLLKLLLFLRRAGTGPLFLSSEPY